MLYVRTDDENYLTEKLEQFKKEEGPETLLS